MAARVQCAQCGAYFVAVTIEEAEDFLADHIELKHS